MTGQHVPAEPTVRVWDPLIRVGHWALVIAVVLAWLTRHGGGVWPDYLGYLSLGVVAMRVLWGWRGSRYARQMLRGQEPRYGGHNPLGG